MNTRTKRAEAQAQVADEYAQRQSLHQYFHSLEPLLVPMLAGLQSAITGHMHRQGFWESENTGEKIALMHSELSEALEADRKNIESDDKVPGFSGLEAELADTVIRILDFAGYHNLRLAEAIIAKMHVNLERPFKHNKAY